MSRPPTLLAQVIALRTETVDELVERYQHLFGRPPRSKQPAWLRSRIAWRLQEQQLGGLSRVATRRLAELIGDIDLRTDNTTASMVRTPLRDDDPQRPRVGTVLTREWRGRELRVTVLDRGFEHEGVTYRSLTAVAKAITGAHWSGNAFFGLVTRRRKG